jgi:hypothetical protein
MEDRMERRPGATGVLLAALLPPPVLLGLADPMPLGLADPRSGGMSAAGCCAMLLGVCGCCCCCCCWWGVVRSGGGDGDGVPAALPGRDLLLLLLLVGPLGEYATLRSCMYFRWRSLAGAGPEPAASCDGERAAELPPACVAASLLCCSSCWSLARALSGSRYATSSELARSPAAAAAAGWWCCGRPAAGLLVGLLTRAALVRLLLLVCRAVSLLTLSGEDIMVVLLLVCHRAPAPARGASGSSSNQHNERVSTTH